MCVLRNEKIIKVFTILYNDVIPLLYIFNPTVLVDSRDDLGGNSLSCPFKAGVFYFYSPGPVITRPTTMQTSPCKPLLIEDNDKVKNSTYLFPTFV